MKRILVIGEHSYIGKAFREYMKKHMPEVEVTLTGAKNGEWEKIDMQQYDAALHAAAVVHQKEKPQMKKLYHEVNAVLPYSVAKKAKKCGVGHFVFLSTMAVYGEDVAMIGKDAPIRPVTMYAKSKWKAERGLRKLADDDFRVTILRPPMVFGPGCPGNYPRLSGLAVRLSVFPKVRNKRSMIYIENLCECIRQELTCAQRNENCRTVCPQDAEYVNTTELVKEIRRAHGKRTWEIPFLEKPILWAANKNGTLKKVFGNCCYDKDEENKKFQTAGFCEAVRRTER